MIRPATVDDAEPLTDLHLDVWEQAYRHLISAALLAERRRTRSDRVARWRANIANGAARTTLAWRDDGRLLGFVSVGPGRDRPSAGSESPDHLPDHLPGHLPDHLPDLEVWALYVRAEVYGEGVGHALLSDALGPAAAYLWVLDGNERAIAFYDRQGFRFDGCTKSEPEGVERRMVRRGTSRAT